MTVSEEMMNNVTALLDKLIKIQCNLYVLCADHMTESVEGGMTDTEAIWPSDILRILDLKK